MEENNVLDPVDAYWEKIVKDYEEEEAKKEVEAKKKMKKMGRLQRRMMKLAGYEVDVRNDQDYTEAKSYTEEEQGDWKDAYYLLDRISRIGGEWVGVAEAVKMSMHYYNDGSVARPGSAWGTQDANLVQPAIRMFNKKYSNDPAERAEYEGDLGEPFQSLVYGLEQSSSRGGVAGVITDWEAILGCIQNIDWNKGRQ